MDARITKQRLANQLSYDWMKIIAAAIGVIFLFLVIFTTIATSPTNAQCFTVYAYTDLKSGEDANLIADTLKTTKTLSYETLKVEFEAFGGNDYANEAFTARRAAGQGDVMFISDNEILNEDGTLKTASALKTFCVNYAGVGRDTEEFFAECEEYLNGFFGDWRTGDLDEEKAKQAFLIRNEKDKRFKRDAQIQAGIESEFARLNDLRDDLRFVYDCFERGLFSHTYFTPEGETTAQAVAIRVGGTGMSGLTRLLYHLNEDGTAASNTINLIVFDNKDRNGEMEYETVTFRRYLAETYENVQA